MYKGIKDESITSRSIQEQIDSWETTYGGDKPSTIDGVLNSIREGFCEQETIVRSEAAHLCRQLNRKIMKGDLTGCGNAIRKNYLQEDAEDSKVDEYNDIVSIIDTKFKDESRVASMDAHLKNLEDKYKIQAMFNEDKAFFSENAALNSVSKLCYIISEDYSGRLSNANIATVCMEANRRIYDAMPGVVSEDKILTEVSRFFMIHPEYSFEEISEALDEVRTFDSRDIEVVKEAVNSTMDSIVLLEDMEIESVDDLDSPEFKRKLQRKGGKLRNVYEDMIGTFRSSKAFRRNKRKERRSHGGNVAKNTFNSFKKSLYATPPETIIDDVPNMMKLVRFMLFLGGAGIIHPCLGIVGAIIDSMIVSSVDLDYIPDLIKKLKIEREMAQNSLRDSRMKLDDDKKEELKEYIDQLDLEISKLEDHIKMYDIDEYMHEDYYNENHNRYMGTVLAISEMMLRPEGDDMLLTENVVTNTMRRAKEKLRSGIETLSAKEKAASKRLDSAINSFTDSFEKAMRLDNREKVIRGSVLPDASKVIKMAIATGAAWAISPAIALVGALSSWAISKDVRDKERQIIYDEIDTHLRIVERKIQQADRHDDLDAVEELMKLEGKLKREKQRIEYRRKAYK